MQRLVLIFAFLIGVLNAAYVPGTPGGSWTDEEMIVTKGKLVWIMRNSGKAMRLVKGGKKMLDLYNSPELDLTRGGEAIAPTLAKVVRLTFHDCLPEADGLAKCNGCLNFEGMGNMYSKDECSSKGTCETINGGIHPATGPMATDNNNLYWVAAVLEELYKDPKFGPDGYPQHLSESLFDTGKSRADLWAFAGLVAVQLSAAINNKNCQGAKGECASTINRGTELKPCSYDFPYTEFRWGRSDCIPDCEGSDAPPFCTTAHEFHPNPQGNGEQTIDFFRTHFGFTADESIALMGVHTLGHPNEVNSMFRHYPWTSGATNVLDNEYYINIMNATNYRTRNMGRVGADGTCYQSRYIGDEWGQPWDVQYLVRSERRTSAHGPWNWNLFGRECNLAKCQQVLTSEGSYNVNSCCIMLERCLETGDNKECVAFKGCSERDPNCEQPRFFGVNMLSPDMGLYRKFTIDENGRPRGCPGLESSTDWLDNKRTRFSLSPDCPINDTPTESGHYFAEVVEHYATSPSDVWVLDFVQVFGKMLEMGYTDLDMTPAPESWYYARMKKGGVWGV